MSTFVRLLGRPSIQRGNDELEPRAGKTSSLLFYLAYRRGWVARDAVLDLLYAETDEPRARQNLRTLLTKIRRFPGARDVEIEPGRVRWAVSTDLVAFEEALADGRLPLALELYRGPLLEGFAPAPSGSFEAWLELERLGLEQRWHDAALELAAELDAQGRHRDAATVLARALAAEPLDESALRLQLRALASTGDRTAALAAYEAFAERLADELRMEPEAATLRLADRLRGGDVDDLPDDP
ncbi:MAG TPA: BTAD domain-containing putative transcriptional regulator, partial [Trueperaceae bacterium]|nr:BTAD domain-containing putative transcriptional regulator [Trueperaceae bacterium]